MSSSLQLKKGVDTIIYAPFKLQEERLQFYDLGVKLAIDVQDRD